MALDVREVGAIERAVSTFAKEPNGGMIVLATPLATVHRDVIVQLAARERLPTIYPYRYFVTSGGLVSYGIDNTDLWWRSASCGFAMWWSEAIDWRFAPPRNEPVSLDTGP